MTYMLEDLLRSFLARTGTWSKMPDTVLYFRGGVSIGQISTVLDAEYKSILEAFHRAGCPSKPQVLIVVGMRSSKEFKPEDLRDGNKFGNVPPGTVLDAGIALPGYFNFYMCSQDGIIGTTRP